MPAIGDFTSFFPLRKKCPRLPDQSLALDTGACSKELEAAPSRPARCFATVVRSQGSSPTGYGTSTGSTPGLTLI